MSGVRSSCDTVRRKSSLARLACSAAVRAFSTTRRAVTCSVTSEMAATMSVTTPPPALSGWYATL